MKNVLFSISLVFEKLRYNLQISLFHLCNLLIDNVPIKCRFIKINGRFIRINGLNIFFFRQNILANRHPLKILPLQNVLFSLSPILFLHFNCFLSDTISLNTLKKKFFSLIVFVVSEKNFAVSRYSELFHTVQIWL